MKEEEKREKERKEEEQKRRKRREFLHPAYNPNMYLFIMRSRK